MQSRIKILEEKKLIGKQLSMSLVNNRTHELWSGFMPSRNKISNRLTTDFISMQVYNLDYFQKFNPHNEFEKWAIVEVSDFENVPDGMKTFVLETGMYAVFDYKGLVDPSFFQYIFSEWLPNSKYKLDDRPHFELLGEKYKKDDPNSEEEIWIPIQPKVKVN